MNFLYCYCFPSVTQELHGLPFALYHVLRPGVELTEQIGIHKPEQHPAVKRGAGPILASRRPNPGKNTGFLLNALLAAFQSLGERQDARHGEILSHFHGVSAEDVLDFQDERIAWVHLKLRGDFLARATVEHPEIDRAFAGMRLDHAF